jgi:hypothetical protein
VVTPADHANTVRDALNTGPLPDSQPDRDKLDAGHDALDALLAQAEAAEKRRIVTTTVQGDTHMNRLREERDAALDREAGTQDALDATRRQSEEQAEEAIKWRLAAEQAHAALRLALRGIPDPMHPGIPREFEGGLVHAQIVMLDALGDDDPGNVEAARAALSAREEAWTHEDRMVLGEGGC